VLDWPCPYLRRSGGDLQTRKEFGRLIALLSSIGGERQLEQFDQFEVVLRGVGLELPPENCGNPEIQGIVVALDSDVRSIGAACVSGCWRSWRWSGRPVQWRRRLIRWRGCCSGYDG